MADQDEGSQARPPGAERGGRSERDLARLFEPEPVVPPRTDAEGPGGTDRVEKLARIFSEPPPPVGVGAPAAPPDPAAREGLPEPADRSDPVVPTELNRPVVTTPDVDRPVPPGPPPEAPPVAAAPVVDRPVADDRPLADGPLADRHLTGRSGAGPRLVDREPDVPDRSSDRGSMPDGPPPPSPGTSRWWRIGYPTAIALAVLAVPVLVWLGVQTILGSTEGTRVSTVQDPGAPGYERLVDPTPTFLVLAEDPSGGLASVTFLALTGEEAGGVVAIPPATLITDGEGGGGTLEAVYATGGADEVRSLVERQLNARVEGVRILDDDDWAALLAPVAPLEVDNPDEVRGEDGEVAFPSGELALEPEQVGPYLATHNEGESDLNRMVRLQQFWSAWLGAVGDAGDREDVVPGEVSSGLGRFVRALGGDTLEVATLPVDNAPLPGSDASVFAPVTERIGELVTRLVPFPSGAPAGARLRVRLLDGAGGLDHGLGAVRTLTGAGGEVRTIGNAAAFDVATTQFVYHDEALRERVEALRDALGRGEVVRTDQVDDAIDVTVVLGADARDAADADGPVATAAPADDGTTEEGDGDGA